MSINYKLFIIKINLPLNKMYEIEFQVIIYFLLYLNKYLFIKAQMKKVTDKQILQFTVIPSVFILFVGYLVLTLGFHQII